MTGRGLRGRRQARLMIVAAVAPGVVVALLLMTAPQVIGPLGGESSLGIAILACGFGLYGTGLLWMIRIYRTDPEGHHSFFRSLGF